MTFRHGIVKRLLIDMQLVIKSRRYWIYKSNLNYRLNYRDSKLGVLWPSISTIIVCAVLGTLWGVIFEKENLVQYYLYLVTGFPVWQALSASVHSGSRGFDVSQLASHLPFSLPAFERSTTSILHLVYLLPLVILVNLMLGEIIFINLVWFPLAILCVILWSMGTVLCLSVLVTLVPDLKQLVSAVMRLAFLATPIIWEPQRLGQYQEYLWLNPFFPPIEFMRAVFSDNTQTQSIITVAPVYSIVLFLMGLVLFGIYQPRLKQRVG